MTEEIYDLYTAKDKLQWWGEGEWVHEPDKILFTYNGIDCMVVRMCVPEGPNHQYRFGGYLNGYARVPKDHPIYGKSDDDIPDNISPHVNGGLTFSKITQNDPLFPKDGHWIGFDCCHFWDYTPSIEHLHKTLPEFIEFEKIFPDPNFFSKSYKNIPFCIGECQCMVDQLIAMMEKARMNNER
jgi:hypothetical protein